MKMDTTRTVRQFVGGPYDRQQRLVPASDTLVLPAPPVAPTYVFVPTTTQSGYPWVEWGDEPAKYRATRAPTGEKVMLLDGTCWPDRFDMEQWPARAVPGRETWTRLAPWVWRGTGQRHGYGVRPGYDGIRPQPMDFDTWTYVCGEVRKSGTFQLYGREVPAHLVDIGDRELAWHALADEPTPEDQVVSELLYDADIEMLPRCPVMRCTDKARLRLTAGMGGAILTNVTEYGSSPDARARALALELRPGDTIDLCLDHVHQELKRAPEPPSWHLPWAGYPVEVVQRRYPRKTP
jgi:hypothetical protein